MKVKLFFLLTLLSLSTILHSFAQTQDSISLSKPVPKLSTPSPSITREEPRKDAARLRLEKMPRRALLRSMVIPGWGQATNKRWWKIPLIYGGLYLFIKEYNANRNKYHEYLKEAQYRVENPTKKYGDPAYQLFTTDGIIKTKDLYSRNTDLCALALIGIYAANVLDAYVDAKFFQFDISDKLSLKVRPSFQVVPQTDTYALLNPTLKISLSL